MLSNSMETTLVYTYREYHTRRIINYQAKQAIGKTMIIIITNCFKHQVTVAESENIGANHLGFTKFLFQQYSQQLELNSNHYSAESAFNFYVNNKITECLGGTVNIEAARENFYTELFQHTNFPRNYSFAPIIREINQIIKRYMQQQFPITYADKDKGKIQTPTATPKEIQLPSWKKHRMESPTARSYHYIPESAINISSADMSTSNAISTFGRFQFQSKQWKEDLLGPYRVATTPWELSEEEEEGKFKTPNFQTPINPNLENSENTTPNIQTLQNLEQINQNNLSLNIIIDQPPIDPIAKSIHQFIQQPHQPNQQSLQQPQQMAYAPIAKLEKFTGNKDDAQTWINNITKAIVANNWDNARALQSLVAPPQTFQQFKTEFLRYFSNNNSINRLANTFNTIKQGDTETVTTYLGHFHKNLRQIQAIEVCPMHPADLPTAVTQTRDFEAAELETNHAQAVNLVINRLSELDSKLKQFKDATSNNSKPNQQLLINTIPPATIFNDKFLAAIFPFELKEITLVLLFSGAILKEKPITAIYTDARVDGYPIKLILDSGLAGSIITRQFMDQLGRRVDCAANACIITADGATKTPIGKIDDFPFEINGLVTPIKGLVIEATQYQALVENDWLSKTNAVLDWITQELQFRQNGQHI
ncbi:hypothetical protein G9A89_009634 [Geosiphon pyriformis]|nr:hypothetical protein G9A89_009634 [Geosiphon pyriformis]